MHRADIVRAMLQRCGGDDAVEISAARGKNQQDGRRWWRKTIIGKTITTCLVPLCDGVSYAALPTQETLWDRYYMVAVLATSVIRETVE